MKVKISDTPDVTQDILRVSQSKQEIKQRIKKWAELLEKIPCVDHVTVDEDGEEGHFLCIAVHSDISMFLKEKNDREEKALFFCELDGTIRFLGDTKDRQDTIFTKWVKKRYSNLPLFMEALFDLVKRYAEVISEVKKD